MKRIILFAGIAILFMFSVAQATIIYDTDPAILHIGNPPNTGDYLYNGELIQIGDTNLSILMNGQETLLNNPLLLILGIPDATSVTPIPGISSLSTGSFINPTAFTALTSGSDAYGVLGLGGNSNNSNSFNNWQAADLAVNGINATSFGLFVYLLNDTNFATTNPLDITFLSSLPVGTFAIAYGETEEVKHNGDIEITPYSTPITEAGLTTKVPEPNTMILLGSGLLGLALYGRRKFRK